LFPLFALLRASLALLLVVAFVGALAFAVALIFIHPNAYKSDIEASVQRATGRTLAMRGPIRLHLGLSPRLTAEDIELSNPQGASRPQMLTLARVEARVALWPLFSHHLVVTDLTLVQPDIALERDAAGRGNWLLRPATPPPSATPATAAPEAAAQSPAPPPASHWRFAIRAVHLDQGRIGWHPGPGAAPLEILLPRVDAEASSADGEITLTGSVSVNDRSLLLSGETGSLDQLFERDPLVPWPLSVALQDSTARIAASGTLAEPLRGRGLSLQLDVAITDFTGLSPFLPADFSAREATVAAHWDDGGLTALTAKFGAVRLPKLLPDADIRHAEMSAPAPDQPVHAEADGSSPTLGKLSLVLTAGRLGGMPPADHATVPLDLALSVGAATLTAKGTAVTPGALRGLDLDVAAMIPDLAAFAPVAGHKLPAWHDLAFAGHVTGDLRGPEALGLHAATLTLPQAQLTGEVEWRPGTPPALKADVAAKRIDLDAMRPGLALLLPARPPAPPPAPAPASDTQAAPPPPPSHWLIPDTPIDFSALDRLDADLRVRIDQLQAGGIGYTQVVGQAVLQNGRLAVDRLAATTPAGPAEGRLLIDSHAPDAPVALFLHAPSLQLGQLAALVDADVTATGSVSVSADLHGAGHTPHAIAASLDGHVGIGSADADFDNALLLDLMRLAKLPPMPVNATGSTRLRCVAIGLSFSKGIATADPAVLDLGRFAITAGGSVDFAQETLALQLRTLLRLGGNAGAAGLIVPVRLTGPWRTPKAAPEAGGSKGGPGGGGSFTEPCGSAVAAAMAAPAVARPAPSVPAAGATAAAPAPAPAKPDAARRAAASLLDALKNLQVPAR
jgi:hypothetical protein